MLIGSALAISFRLIKWPISDLVRSLRGVLLGSVLMSALVDALLTAHLESNLVLAISTAIGVLAYGTWLLATNADAMHEVRSRGFRMW